MYWISIEVSAPYFFDTGSVSKYPLDTVLAQYWPILKNWFNTFLSIKVSMDSIKIKLILQSIDHWYRMPHPAITILHMYKLKPPGHAGEEWCTSHWPTYTHLHLAGEPRRSWSCASPSLDKWPTHVFRVVKHKAAVLKYFRRCYLQFSFLARFI